MPSRDHTRRLVRELNLPDEADLVVTRPKYWTPDFAWLYLDRVDELIAERPVEGLLVAEVCPELVHLIQTATRQPQDRLKLRALAILGSAYRANDDLVLAEETYREAFGLIRESDTIVQPDVANLFYRFSYVLSFTDRYAEAVKVSSQSITIYRDAPDEVQRRYLGLAITTRGNIHYLNGRLALAMKDWSQAVACTDAKVTPRIFFALVHNLATGMTDSAVLSRDLSIIERYITQASRYFNRKPLSLPKLKVFWLRGMIQCRFGSTRRGEATYRKTIAGFLKLGEVVDMALVSVALGKQLHLEGRFIELKQLAIETHEACDRLCLMESIKRAVFTWKETVVTNTVTAEVFATTWRELERNSFTLAARLSVETMASKSPMPRGNS